MWPNQYCSVRRGFVKDLPSTKPSLPASRASEIEYR
jgi:hypothetical protein